MRALVVPMAAMAETAGPSGRCRILVEGFMNAGVETATCIAKDVNYKEIDGIYNYYLDMPMPLGLPKAIATRTFPIAQRFGIASQKTVSSFDEVLWFTGNLDYRYLRASVDFIREAIHEFRPDVVYSEFNISAIIASKIISKILIGKQYVNEKSNGNGQARINFQRAACEVSYRWSIGFYLVFRKKIAHLG